MIDDERMGLGIGLLSRWQKADEIDRMTQVVEMLPAPLRKRIAAIWCDSCTYRLLVSIDDRQTALLVAEPFEEKVCRVPPGGHHGIWVDSAEGDFLLALDPRWA